MKKWWFFSICNHNILYIVKVHFGKHTYLVDIKVIFSKILVYGLIL